MANGIYNAVSGAVAQTQQLDIIANNLANANTIAYKSDNTAFSEVLSNAAKVKGNMPNSFVTLSEVRTDLRPGMLKPTGNDLDVALEGSGYLCFQDKDQVVYSRGGRLQVRNDGVITDADGLVLLDKSDRPLSVGTDPGKIIFEPSGRVQTQTGLSGDMRVVEFDNPLMLQKRGNTKFIAPASAGEHLAQNTQVRQGYVEGSNFNMVRGMTSMIVASRAYETFSRCIQTFSDLDRSVAGTLGRL